MGVAVGLGVSVGRILILGEGKFFINSSDTGSGVLSSVIEKELAKSPYELLTSDIILFTAFCAPSTALSNSSICADKAEDISLASLSILVTRSCNTGNSLDSFSMVSSSYSIRLLGSICPAIPPTSLRPFSRPWFSQLIIKPVWLPAIPPML